jgi:hypothetical protein
MLSQVTTVSADLGVLAYPVRFPKGIQEQKKKHLIYTENLKDISIKSFETNSIK